ncbi:hypothetical protein CHL78_003475 [Romboutsia weinsteinii]|uniref:LysM domain-containing protein n=1 Tax=Romboutsia weinsteinii TaxID=2020949 RepID=A0A371J8F8_9FIRM|nr:hypothetical protein [Romboutsia weinsteinii]RDY28993.1 hypothetical protein CHL78_003475 [Romboutsia weinsteinii]
MKYFFIFLIMLCFIAPAVEENKDASQVFKDSIYNYITCLDTATKYLSENVPAFSKFAELPYKIAYKKVMDDRVFTKHLVMSGETLDDIICTYNNNVDDIEDFRKVVYMENQDIITKDYEIKSGDYLTVPSD